LPHNPAILYGKTTLIIGTTILDFSIRNLKPYLTATNKDQGMIFLQQLKYKLDYTLGKGEVNDMVIDDDSINNTHLAIQPLNGNISINNLGNELWLSVDDYIMENTSEIFRCGLSNYIKVIIDGDTEIVSSEPKEEHTKIIMQKYPGATPSYPAQK
jgi:hypothetical protein